MDSFFKKLIIRRTFVNAGALFTGNAAARVISAVVIFIVARQLGVEQFGLFTAALSLAKLSSIVFSLGLDSWLLREANRGQNRLGASAGSAFAIKVVLGGLWFLLMVRIAPFLPQETFPTSLVILGAVSVWLEEIGNTAWAAFKAALRNTITIWLIVTSQIVLFIFTVGLTWFDVQNPASFLGARALATAVGGFVSSFFMFRSFDIEFRLSDLPDALRGTVSFGLSHGLAVIYERADITIIAYFLGKAAAGIYSPAISLMTTLFLVPTAVYEVMLPILSKTHEQNEKAIPRHSFFLVLASAVLGIILGGAMVVLAYPLVWLIYTSEFIASAPVLVILSNVLLFKCISFGLAAVLAAVGWQGKRVWVQLVSAVLNIGLNLLIVHSAGIIGVAYVYVFTEFVLTTGYLLLLLQWQLQNHMLTLWRTSKL